MSQVRVTFPRLNQFWNDSGVLGLYRCIIGKVHADPPRDFTDPMDRLDEKLEVEVLLENDRLEIGGEETAVEKLLEHAYNRLAAHYYDLSTKKQQEDTASFNFYYDSQQDQFKTFPKRKAKGIAAFIYDKAPRPAGEQVKWKNKEVGVLPDSHIHLQERLNTFLEQQGIKAGPGAGMLVGQPNRVRPNVTLGVGEGTARKDICFLCGQSSSRAEGINQTVFPFITGSAGGLAFFNQAREVSKVCWRCAFAGKFVPVNGFFTQSGERLHMFFPLAPDLRKMDQVYDNLRTITEWEPNFWRNFEHGLGGYFSHPRETAFAFLYRVYRNLLVWERGEEGKRYDDDDFEEEVLGLALNDAPLSFALVSTEQKGQIQMPTQVWFFDDLVWLFRLFKAVDDQNQNWKDAVRIMVDHDAAREENCSLERDRMLNSVLKKQSMLHRVEQFAYHVNRNKRHYIAPLVDFVFLYESLLKEGGGMQSEAREAAVALGRRIGAAVAKDRGKKGSLFTLRKSRTLPDFLNELSRLQLRLGIAVPPAVYEGNLTQENFEEFRGFCMLAALNSFNAGTSEKTQKGAQDDR